MRSRSPADSGKSAGDQLVLDLPAGGGDHRQQVVVAQAHELDVADGVALGPRGLHHHRQVRQLAQQREVRCMTSWRSEARGPTRSRMPSFSVWDRLRTRSKVST